MAMLFACPWSCRIGSLNHHGAVFAQGTEGILGLGYLSRYRITFDFPMQQMFLEKGQRFDAAQQWNRSGIHLSRVNGKTVIHGIATASPAARKLRKGDVVLSIGEQDADGASLFSLQRHLCRDERQLRIAVQRGDQRIEATLVLEPATTAEGPDPSANSRQVDLPEVA